MNQQRLIRKGGKIIVIGVFGDEVMIKAADLQDKEIELIGSLMYTRSDFHEAIKILIDNKIPAGDIIGKTFKIDFANEAFEYIRKQKENIKTMIEITSEFK